MNILNIGKRNSEGIKVETVKKGVNPSSKMWVGKCRNCETEMKGTKSELTALQDKMQMSYSHPCSECNHTVWFVPE